MRYDKRCEYLLILLQAFKSLYSFYLLGAGTSAKIIPMTRELKRIIVQKYLDFGCYPVEQVIPDDLSIRIIGTFDDYDDPVTAELITRFFPSAIKAMVLKALTRKDLNVNLPQYKIFTLISKPSIICSMNTDGIASLYSSGHFLLEPHGRIPAEIVHSKPWDDLTDAALEFGFECPNINGGLLPQPEPKHITSGKEYIKALRLFPLSNYLIIVGYTFGISDNSFDDFETFEFFRALLRRYPKNVLIIDPAPEHVAGAIQEETSLKTIYPFSVYWDNLCKALTIILYEYQCRDISELSCLTTKVLYKYDELCDKAA